MKNILRTLLSGLLLLSGVLSSQNEAQKWYFGYNAGLDFSTSPPTILTNGAMRTDEGCATISDATGNLLFYTDGISVYNQIHAIMANGSGLNGNTSTTQSAIIVKKPGAASVYYIFTLDQVAGGAGLCYSEVNMTLAAGMGSVTVKNYSLFTPSCEKMVGVRHCNGTDAWVVSHDWNSSNFRSYLITTAGVSLTPVVSSSGNAVTGSNIKTLGQMKVSPNGNKLGLAIYDGSAAPIELYDFSSATGIVSNPLVLFNTTSNYGCEFSPDGTKFYSARCTSPEVFQWDLCAGNNAAIIASKFTIATNTDLNGALQLGPDGKIYLAKAYVPYCSVINSPNATGAACNFVNMGQSLGLDTCQLGFPNFINSYLKPINLPVPFTYTSNCSTYSFSPGITPTVNPGCTGIANSVTGYLWNFGEPLSGTANSSTLTNPSHLYTAAGNFTAQLVRYFTCSSDTVRTSFTLVNASPNLSVTGTFTICKGQQKVFTVTGASSYTWSTAANTSTVALSPTTTTVYTVTGKGTNSCTSTKSFSVVVNPCTSINEINGYIVAKVYPNPFNDALQIETTEPVSIEIKNQVGNMVYSGALLPGTSSLNLDHLKAGVYMVIIQGAGIQRTKLIKLDN